MFFFEYLVYLLFTDMQKKGVVQQQKFQPLCHTLDSLFFKQASSGFPLAI